MCIKTEQNQLCLNNIWSANERKAKQAIMNLSCMFQNCNKLKNAIKKSEINVIKLVVNTDVPLECSAIGRIYNEGKQLPPRHGGTGLCLFAKQTTDISPDRLSKNMGAAVLSP